MKTIIIYASTYGYGKDCAEKLSEQLKGEVILADISKESNPPIDEFDNAVIGGSIYMGQIQKKLKEYCASNVELLKNKRLALFLCSGVPENFDKDMKNAFPEELLQKVIAMEAFGGELRREKLNFVHKIIIKMMDKATAKDGKAPMKQMTENITKLAEIING